MLIRFLNKDKYFDAKIYNYFNQIILTYKTSSSSSYNVITLLYIYIYIYHIIKLYHN